MSNEKADTPMSPEEQINAFWFALEHSWEIEPRSYFEEAAPRNGFGSPLAMAVHYMWKRKPKVEQAFELAAERAFTVIETIDGRPYSTRQKAASVAAAIRALKAQPES